MRLSASDFPEVAVASMHEVHLEEVEMINAIYALLEAIEAGAGHGGLTESLEALLNHTRGHFVGEEALMEQHHFPPYLVHKAAHDAFLSDMERVVDGWNMNQGVEPVRRFMQDVLPIWIMDHTSTMDYITAKFIAMRMEPS